MLYIKDWYVFFLQFFVQPIPHLGGHIFLKSPGWHAFPGSTQRRCPESHHFALGRNCWGHGEISGWSRAASDGIRVGRGWGGNALSRNSKQPVLNGCLMKQPFFYVKIWNHPTETTNKQLLFRVPGLSYNQPGVSDMLPTAEKRHQVHGTRPKAASLRDLVGFFDLQNFCDGFSYLGGGNSNIFYVQPETWGNDSQFDKNIFQMGWNHQPLMCDFT